MERLTMPADIPTGIRFTPTHRELIDPFLTEISKSQGKPSPSSWPVVYKNVYGGENSAPWKLLTDNDPWFPVAVGGKVLPTKKVTYVYTKKTYVSKNRKNVRRRAGNGCWSSENKGKDILRYDDGVLNLIGNYKLLTYKPDGISSKADNMDAFYARYGHWIMHEYTLAGIYGPSDFVICEITKDDEKMMTSAPPLELVEYDHREFENTNKKAKFIDNYPVQTATSIPQQYPFIPAADDHQASTSTAVFSMEEFQNNNKLLPLERPRVNVQGFDARECSYNETLHETGTPQNNLQMDLSVFDDLFTDEEEDLSIELSAKQKAYLDEWSNELLGSNQWL